MSITAEQAVRLVEITQRKADELFKALIEELRQSLDVTDANGGLERLAGVERLAPTAAEGTSGVWSLEGITLSGSWEEVSRESGVTYQWPDGNVDQYSDFVTYRGEGGYAGLTLALGYLHHGDVVGFVLGSGGGSMRGITYFVPADDFDQTREKVSMIRGGGPRGRSGFAPGEALPQGYHGFETDVLRDRKTGKWNVQAVVANEDDYTTMLAHTALQTHLRGLA